MWVGRKYMRMAEKETFNFEWIKNALNKIHSKFSNVVCMETDDKIRQVHLIGYLLDKYKNYSIYVYERWNGLQKYDFSRNNFYPIENEANDKYTANVGQTIGIGNRFLDLKMTLRYMDKLLRSKPTVFILKNLDSAYDNNQDIENELISAIRYWSHDYQIGLTKSIIIIICENSSKVLDGSTLKQVAIISSDLPDETERKILIQSIAQQLRLNVTDSIGSLVQSTAGLTLHQLESILIETYNNTGAFNLEKIKEAKSEFLKRSDLLEIEEPKGGFEAVGGYEVIKRFIIENVVRPLKDPNRAKRFGIPLPRGILFFGPPGTGKTLFSKALAKETTLPFIKINTENLYSKYLGESGQRFGIVIKMAEKMSPAIVFIDEIDRFGKRSSGIGDGASEETRRVFNQILEWLGDGNRKSIIIGTTNRPDDLDEAFIRSGRFDYKIPFLFPDKDARRQILEIHLGMIGSKPKPPINLSREDLSKILEEIVNHTENFSGADLEELINRVKRNAFVRNTDFIEKQDFYKAVNSFRIDKKEREEMVTTHINYAKRYTDNLEFLNQLVNFLER